MKKTKQLGKLLLVLLIVLNALSITHVFAENSKSATILTNQEDEFNNRNNDEVMEKIHNQDVSYIHFAKEIDIEVDGLKITGGDFSISLGKKRFMDYITLLKDVLNSDVETIWSSVNPDVLKTTEDGIVEAVSVGTTTLKVVLKEDEAIFDTVTVTVVDNIIKDDYNIIKERWLKRIVGDDNLNLDNQYIKEYVENLSADAEQLWNELDTTSDRTYLWPIRPGDTTSADYTTQFRNIKQLALAFGTKGSALEGNRVLYKDIVEALTFMTSTKKYNGSYWTQNWWDWQIGSAQPFTDTLMILSDYMSESEIQTFVDCIAGYAHNPAIQWPKYTATGANRTDIGISVLGTAILTQDDDKMALITVTIPPLFQLVTRGDGMYKDGSLIQHHYFAYSGSYGNELLKGIGRILSTIDGTEWEITSDSIKNVYDTVDKGYIPLMQDGRMMSMVSGRGITRAPGTNKFATEYSAGQETISNMMVISTFAPEEYANVFDKNVKYWLEKSKDQYNFFSYARDIEALQNADRIYNDATIEAEYTFSGVKTYSMDRVVQRTEDYALGISFYSNRSGNFELQKQGSNPNIIYENMQGWHQSDGVLFLYNNDYDSYDNGYWATVDSYRLPGTTVDTKTLTIGEKSGVKSPQKWVGGTATDTIGAIGMFLDKTNTNMDLKAKKSWFLLDGQVVALGSDINGTTTASIETIIENRKIAEDKSNLVTINDIVDNGELKEQTLPENSWVHLQGKIEGSDIGYYFPNQTEITTNKETNTESFEKINTLFVDGLDYTGSYFKMRINHGQAVEDEKYAYVILPGKTAEETKRYAENNALEILENSKEVHAIYEANQKVFAMNVWGSSGYSLQGVTVDQSASIILSQEKDIITIAIADPMRQGIDIKLSLDQEYLEIVSMDNKIQLAEDGKNFIFDSTYMAGASAIIQLRVEVSIDISRLDNLIQEAKDIVADDFTPSSYQALDKAIVATEEVLEQETTQETIDAACMVLQQAIDALITVADFSELEALIQAIEQLDLERFTAESWEALEAILVTAKEVVDDKNSSQETVKSTVVILQNSLDGLELKEGLLIDQNKSNANVNTGDFASIDVYVILFLISLLGIMGCYWNKKNSQKSSS